MVPRLTSIQIEGYRPFRDFRADFGLLEIMVGANGSGKSSLFEFLRFLRDGMRQEIPPEIVAGAVGREVFHRPGPDRFGWQCNVNFAQENTTRYQGELHGPIGRTSVASERVVVVPLETKQSSETRMNVAFGTGDVAEGVDVDYDPFDENLKHDSLWNYQSISLKRLNQLALSTITNPAFATLYDLREYISGWRFYSAFNIASDKIRRSVPIEQEPVLNEDAGNLSAVLFYLLTEQREAFDELEQHLRSAVPGFKSLSVKARGGPGEVIAFWQEAGSSTDLTLADLSDGILRLICWFVLCVQPNPPTLICIDEPDQGVHPRTLPVLAGLLQKASERTQIFVATHASYFLMQFALSELAVFRKENGEAKFYKPANSQVLVDNLQDFGPDELEVLHRSDELERLA